MISPAARALIESGRLAHMVTVNPDGSPQVSCVWVGMDGDEPDREDVVATVRSPDVCRTDFGANDRPSGSRVARRTIELPERAYARCSATSSSTCATRRSSPRRLAPALMCIRQPGLSEATTVQPVFAIASSFH